MRRAVALALACVVLCPPSMAAEPAPAPAREPEFSILQDGGGDTVYHGGEAPLQPGTGWLALDVVAGRWHLLPATLRGEQSIDPIGATNTGVRLHAQPANALLYLRLPGLVAGKVDTPDIRFKNHYRPFGDAMAMPLAFKGRTWLFEVRRHELVLSEGGTSMSFGQVVDPDDLDAGLGLLWAGDLDHDGRLDFVFEGSGKNSSEICVWLSSLAKPGEPVGRASCWGTTGC
jgi:hypothetical protein